MEKITRALAIMVTLSNIPRLPFVFNGALYNNGQICELAYKAALNLPPVWDSNGSWETSDDVPSTGESVKSRCFSACESVLKGDTITEKIADFAKRVHSKKFVYIILDLQAKTITCYHMDLTEFIELLTLFGTIEKNSNKPGRVKLRVKHETSKLIKWLEEKSRA